MRPDENPDRPQGPPSYSNWRAYLETAPWNGAYEVPFYTDARITGEIRSELGPYLLINTVPMPLRAGYGVVLPAIVLRAEIHDRRDPYEFPPMTATDDSLYHGGDLEDEIAALVSLCLGIRLRAGTPERVFRPNQDPRGIPVAHEGRTVPVLLTRGIDPIIPFPVGPCALEDALLIGTLPGLSIEQSATLIRTARSYQNGMWIAEVEPQTAWLLFVSAIEAAADLWSSATDDPVEVLQQSKPEFSAYLHETSGEGLVARVAKEFAPITRAKQKFVRFVLEFLPDPPSNRPPPETQFEWSRAAMKDALSRIYEYRSKALHEGTPFPYPMCEHPLRYSASDLPAEIPLGLAARYLGGTWLREDTPMLLHTFEYIVRGALLNWWNPLSRPAGSPC
jgi:hypothetical protein